MKPRISTITNQIGVQIKTPILVPSYSSKGFAIKSDGQSEISAVIRIFSEFLTDTVLVSAYDIYHNLIPEPEELGFTDLIFVDSGGYETSSNFDFSTVKKISKSSEPWDIDKYNEVLKSWPEEYNTVIVSYDHHTIREPISDQISKAKELFNKYPEFLSDFLIKPTTKDSSYIKVEEIIQNVASLNHIDIIGVTEVELGSSIQKRMQNISKIRNAMEGAGITAPIHVFGSLDPVTSILYFLAGAEIFDGLTWLRYAYFNGMAVYPANFGVLHKDNGIHLKDRKVQLQQISKNINNLEKLKYVMTEYVNTDKIEIFDQLGVSDLSKILSDIIENLSKE